MAELGLPEMTGGDLVRLSRALEGAASHHRKLARAFAQIQSDPALAKRVSELGAELAPSDLRSSQS